MTAILDPFVGILGDIMGCEEGDTECIKNARRYASVLVYGTILVIILFGAYKVHRMLKA